MLIPISDCWLWDRGYQLARWESHSAIQHFTALIWINTFTKLLAVTGWNRVPLFRLWNGFSSCRDASANLREREVISLRLVFNYHVSSAQRFSLAQEDFPHSLCVPCALPNLLQRVGETCKTDKGVHMWAERVKRHYIGCNPQILPPLPPIFVTVWWGGVSQNSMENGVGSCRWKRKLGRKQNKTLLLIC